MFQLEILYRVSEFTWLIFLENLVDDYEFYKQLIVPYNCEFIIVSSVDENKYNLHEVYNIKNLTEVYDFGIWERSIGLSVTNIPLYRRRINLKNAELILNSYQGKNVG